MNGNEAQFKEMMLDKVLFGGLLATHDEDMTAWKRLEILNGVKEDLCDALTAFTPDLPHQFSSQVESIVGNIRDQIEMIWDDDEFMGFMELYKIKLDGINAMMDQGHKESGDIWSEEQDEKDNFDEHTNIRAKMLNFEVNFTKIYEKMKERGLESMSMNGLKMWIGMFKKSNAERVEWMKRFSDDKSE